MLHTVGTLGLKNCIKNAHLIVLFGYLREGDLHLVDFFFILYPHLREDLFEVRLALGSLVSGLLCGFLGILRSEFQFQREIGNFLKTTEP